MTFSSTFTLLLAMLALGTTLITEAAGRPWGSWPTNNTAIQNIQEGGEEERVTIPSFVLNYTSPLAAESTKQYAALWENHTLGQHIEAFCRNANLVCDSNLTTNDPRMGISRNELHDAQLFDDKSELYVDGEDLQFGEEDFVEGKSIVLPENLHEFSNRSPAFLPDFLAKKMTLSSEKIQELLDTFHISHDSKLANMMLRTVHHCEVVKEKTSKEIEVTKEKQIKEKEVVLSKEREFEGKEIEHEGKEYKEKETKFNKENEVEVKKNEDREFIVSKEKEIEQTKEQSIMEEVKKKSSEKSRKKEMKKKTVQSKEKKTKEKEAKMKEVDQSKVKKTKGKRSRKNEIEKSNEKDLKEKKFKENVRESTKDNSSDERKIKDKETEYKKKQLKEKEKEIKEKNIHKSGEKSFHIREDKDSEDKKEMELKKKGIHRGEEKSKEGKTVKEKETRYNEEKETVYKKEKDSKEKDFHITEEKVLEGEKVKEKGTKKSREERKFEEGKTKYYKDKELKDNGKKAEKSKEMKLKKKDVHGSDEKSKLLKGKEIEHGKEKEMKEKDTYVKKEESSKEISKCMTSLEGMTSFVKKSLPKEKHIKALDRSTSTKYVEKAQKKTKWKVLGFKKYEKAVVCKSKMFLFAVYKCHDINKIGNKSVIYHIEVEGMDGVHRKEIIACKGKNKTVDSNNHKAKNSTSTMKVSCQWVKSNSIVWA